MTHAGAASIDSVEPARWERATDLFLRWREGDGRAMDDLVRLMTPPLCASNCRARAFQPA